MPTVAKILRYPVKGLSPQELPDVALTPDQALPFDRKYALLQGTATAESGHHEEGWRPKTDFLMLMRHEKLATLHTEFDEATQMLVIHRAGKPVARGRLDQPMGRMLVEQFFAAYMKDAAPGAPKIAEAQGFAFTDTKHQMVSLLNPASVRDIERITRHPVDPNRFRANLWLDDLPAWAEREWVGKTITVGGARMEVLHDITRCAATEVDPATGARDLNVLQALQRGFGHAQCGIYARVTDGGRVAQGDPVTVD